MQSSFKIKKINRIPKKKIEEMSLPKRNAEAIQPTASQDQLQSIIKDCEKLKYKVLTDKKVNKFIKNASKYYEYLRELSNFNFQKYESS